MAGRGDQYIEHGGYTWRTLDGAAPQEGIGGAPNAGCQCTDGSSSCPNPHGTSWGGDGSGANYLPLPAGWVLAPNDATSIAVVAAHGWSTACAVLADGTAWYSANWHPGASCGSGNSLATSGGTYTVTGCGGHRLLARCG